MLLCVIALLCHRADLVAWQKEVRQDYALNDVQWKYLGNL